MNDRQPEPIGPRGEDVPLSVLVVEDMTDAGESVVEVLSLCGFSHVALASTGGAALERAAADPPDVVLLDIGLPDVDGWEVARSLRERCSASNKTALVVAVTGHGSADDRRKSEEAGVDLHLVKPVEPAVLVGLLRRFARVLSPDSPTPAN